MLIISTQVVPFDVQQLSYLRLNLKEMKQYFV